MNFTTTIFTILQMNDNKEKGNHTKKQNERKK